MTCPKCGGLILGDGYTEVEHCEFVEDVSDYEPDAGPILCDYVEEIKSN